MSARVAVIGGGVAGLACACELADAGLEVLLLESTYRLGGRAYSFRERETGELIDNCQHLILGCCDAAKVFLTRISSIGLVEFQDTAEFVDGRGERLSISASRLPAPVHLLPSVAGSRYLSGGEKLRLLGVMAGLSLKAAGSGSAEAYLRSLGCTGGLMDRLIEPILESALNERAVEASAKYARMVLAKSLLGGRASYRLGVPRAPLARLIEAPAARYLSTEGAEVRLGARVEKLNYHAGWVSSATLASGEEISADVYVSAVPPRQLRRMGHSPASVGPIEWRPIIGAHLFFEGDAPAFGPACLPGEPFGWVFNKSRDFGLRRCYVHAVASAAGDIARLSRGDLTYLALRAASRAAPEIDGARLRQAVIVREMRATLSTAATSDSSRPGTATRVPNLFLAGDWIATGWPSTIESAVLSGHLAANAVRESVGARSDRVVLDSTQSNGL